MKAAASLGPQASLLLLLLLHLLCPLFKSGTASMALMPSCNGPQRVSTSTKDGQVCGVADAAKARFLGIPYAEPPTGARRWKPPVKKSGWGDPDRDHGPWLDASHFGMDCAQLGPAWPSLGPLNNSATSLGLTGEDCLTLNVFVPHSVSSSSSALLPVIVFIPAGAMEWGSANDIENNGSAVGVGPGWQNTVLVTVNYRLGVMGFLYSKELRHERGPGAGLYGILDQQLALRWVQDNIKNFGGDPSSVTLFGESAGATSVSVHMALPSSFGLFHRAAINSGAFNSWTNKTTAQAQATFDQLSKNLGCSRGGQSESQSAKSIIDCMASKDALTLVRSTDPYYGNGTACMYQTCPKLDSLPNGESLTATLFAPVTEYEILPVAPIAQLESGQLAPNVPVLLGTNRDEGSLFCDVVITDSDEFDAWAERNFGADVAVQLPQIYNLTITGGKYTNWWYAAIAAAGDFSLTCPTRRAARALARRPGNKSAAWAYLFAHPPQTPLNRPDPPFPDWKFGAYHGSECVYPGLS